jgi:hypothetical protein
LIISKLEQLRQSYLAKVNLSERYRAMAEAVTECIEIVKKELAELNRRGNQ